MAIQVGDEITYDLLLSKSTIDRRKGKFLSDRGRPHTAEGTIRAISKNHVKVSGRGYLDFKLIPKDAIL